MASGYSYMGRLVIGADMAAAPANDPSLVIRRSDAILEFRPTGGGADWIQIAAATGEFRLRPVTNETNTETGAGQLVYGRDGHLIIPGEYRGMHLVLTASVNPSIRFFNEAASAGSRAWDIVTTATTMAFRSLDDAFGTPVLMASLSRLGDLTVPRSLFQTGGFSSNFAGQVNFDAAVTMQGLLGVSGSISSSTSISAPSLLVSGSQRQTGSITATPTATQHNWTPPGLSTASVIRAGGVAERTVTGIDAQLSGYTALVINDSVSSLIFPAENTGSVAANRFAGGATVAPHRMAMIYRDATVSRWRVS